jgi:hypothetical protein
VCGAQLTVDLGTENFGCRWARTNGVEAPEDEVKHADSVAELVTKLLNQLDERRKLVWAQQQPENPHYRPSSVRSQCETTRAAPFRRCLRRSKWLCPGESERGRFSVLSVRTVE